MKKVLVIVLAAVMILSCSMTAFAEVYIDGEEMSKDHKETATQVKVSWQPTGGGTGVDVTVQEGSSDPKYVSVSKAGEKLYINNNNVKGDSTGSKPTIQSITDDYGIVEGNPTSAVSVGGDVKESRDKDAVVADKHGLVWIEGNVTEAGAGDAVNVNDGSRVTVKGKVEESDDGNAIKVTSNSNTDASTTVEVYGDVIEKDAGDAIYAKGQKTAVTVYRDVTESGDGYAIFAVENSAVTVGGDVTGDGKAILADAGGKVIVEGVVNGNVQADTTSAVYIGTLNGEIESVASKDNIHYLIGTADGSESWKSLIVTGNTDYIAQYGVRGADYDTIYRYTTTADADKLSGKTFNLKSPDSKKKLIVQGIAAGADVTLVSNTDGSVTLTLGSNFKGGLQELMLIFEDIIVRNSNGGGSSKTINTGSAANPVTNGKWTQNADGTWSYATAYKFTDTWGCIANPNDANSVGWYYFDRNGNMLTGWQLLTWNGVKKWYYFSQTKDANEGKCLINGITPDGYRVGPDGAWIEG